MHYCHLSSAFIWGGGINKLILNDVVTKHIVQLIKGKNMTQCCLEQESGIIHGILNRVLASQNKTVTF